MDSTTNNSIEGSDSPQPTGQPGQETNQAPEIENDSTQEAQQVSQPEPVREDQPQTQEVPAQEDLFPSNRDEIAEEEQLNNQSEPVQAQQPETQEEPVSEAQSQVSSESIIESEPSAMPPKEQKGRRVRKRRRGSIFFPILLIIVGGALLLSNLGFLSTSVWGTLISLWPVILIAWGLDAIWRGEGITGAVFLLGLGCVFLLGNLGYLQLNPWQVLFTIWPVLLVAVGIDILIGRKRNVWTTLLGVVLVVALMAGALWLAGVGSPVGVAVSGDQVEFGLQGATSAQVKISPSTANLQLDTMNTPDMLLAGTVPQSTAGQTVTQEFTKAGDVANLNLGSSGFQVYYSPSQVNQSVWKLSFTRLVPVDLAVSLGAGESTLDLSEALLSNFKYNMGVGSTTITVPQSGSATIEVNQAIGQVTILVPVGTAIQLASDGLAARSLPAGYQEMDHQIYQSPDYASAENKVNLGVNLAIGQVTIRQK